MQNENNTRLLISNKSIHISNSIYLYSKYILIVIPGIQGDQ